MSEKCQYGEDTREMLVTLENKLNSNLNNIWKELREQRTRLSPVITTIISILMMAVGTLGTALAVALK